MKICDRRKGQEWFPISGLWGCVDKTNTSNQEGGKEDESDLNMFSLVCFELHTVLSDS